MKWACVFQVGTEFVFFEDVEDGDRALVLNVSTAPDNSAFIQVDLDDLLRCHDQSSFRRHRLTGRRRHPAGWRRDRAWASRPSARASVTAGGPISARLAASQPNQRGPLHEVEHAEAGGEAGAARRGKHMVRSCHIVTDRLRRVPGPGRLHLHSSLGRRGLADHQRPTRDAPARSDRRREPPGPCRPRR